MRWRLSTASILVVWRMVLGFEIFDLPRMERRLLLYQRGVYGCSLPRFVLGSTEEQKRVRYARVQFFQVSETRWDNLFSATVLLPVNIIEDHESVSFGPWKITPAGIAYYQEHKFFSAISGTVVFYLPLNAIRFDDALAWCKQGSSLTTWRLKAAMVCPEKEKVSESDKLEELLKGQQDEVIYVLKTVSGLWSRWIFQVKTEKVKSVSYPGAGLIIPSGGQSPTFINSVREVESGGQLTCKLQITLFPEETPFLAPGKNKALSLFDTHTHVTSSTDLTDTVLMARKYGYKLGLLSIAYDEKPYHRLFLGNTDMLEVIRRYPDVFVGLGLIQLNDSGYPGFPRKGPDTVQEIESLWRKGCQGIKIMEKWSRVDVADSRFDELYRKMVELGLPVVFHTNAEGLGCANSRVAEVARRFPSLPVVIAHVYDEGQLDTTIEAMKKYPNLYLQHMHISRIKDAWKKLAEANLSGQILFGSDAQDDYLFLLAERAKVVKELEKAGFSATQVEAVLFKNAQKIFSQVKPRQ
ncbi:MAG: amidohydrolase family protein [Candidatus Omnitrophica bacterium]|nr:amidohydrolase family protein [Candidatus Omnitrophota bacterium]